MSSFSDSDDIYQSLIRVICHSLKHCLCLFQNAVARFTKLCHGIIIFMFKTCYKGGSRTSGSVCVCVCGGGGGQTHISGVRFHEVA